jgi:uncharacterized membrane protein
MPAKPEKTTYIALGLLALIHAAFTFVYALTRIYSYKASLLDIGLFDQLFWNILRHGTPITTATLPFTPQHWFGFHFSPLLFALVPFYSMWPHLETLQAAECRYSLQQERSERGVAKRGFVPCCTGSIHSF